MTGKIDAVLGAFQDADESYRVMRLPIKRCIALMKAKPTRSRGPSAGRAGMIPRQEFEEENQLIDIVRIEEPEVSGETQSGGRI